MKYLFIGGVADGQWHEVPENSEYWAIEKAEGQYKRREDGKIIDCPIFEKYTYRKEFLVSKSGTTHEVFMHGDVDIILALIKGYRRSCD